MRKTYARAINLPKTFAGIEVKMLFAAFCLSLVIGAAGDTLTHAFWGALLFMVLCGTSTSVTRKDPRFLPILMSIRKHKGLYDAGKYQETRRIVLDNHAA